MTLGYVVRKEHMVKGHFFFCATAAAGRYFLCLDIIEQMFYNKENERGQGRGKAADLCGHRSEIFLRLCGVRGTGAGPADYQSGGGGCPAHQQDHLPGGVPVAEELWHPRAAPAV